MTEAQYYRSGAAPIQRRGLLVGGTLAMGAAATGCTPPAPAANGGSENATIARTFFTLLGRKDVDGWAKLWAQDGRILVPYPPAGFPSEIAGRDEIVRGFRDLFANFESFAANLTGIYPAADSDVVVVEYDVDATLRTGARYTNRNIAVFRFRGELIAAYHDYFDPRRFQVVVAALPKEP